MKEIDILLEESIRLTPDKASRFFKTCRFILSFDYWEIPY
jgi:hypothetical protein